MLSTGLSGAVCMGTLSPACYSWSSVGVVCSFRYAGGCRGLVHCCADVERDWHRPVILRCSIFLVFDCCHASECSLCFACHFQTLIFLRSSWKQYNAIHTIAVEGSLLRLFHGHQTVRRLHRFWYVGILQNGHNVCVVTSVAD